MTYKQFDVVVVPFPFTDTVSARRRPALVLSNAKTFNQKIGHSVLAMITSAKNSAWPIDTPITDLDSAGLTASSIVRMKLFTLDHQLIIRKAGTLSKADQASTKKALAQLFKG